PQRFFRRRSVDLKGGRFVRETNWKSENELRVPRAVSSRLLTRSFSRGMVPFVLLPGCNLIASIGKTPIVFINSRSLSLINQTAQDCGSPANPFSAGIVANFSPRELR